MQIADYIIVEKIRSSSHGTVYAAAPPERLGVSSETVALKTLKQHADGDDFRRVANELKLLHQANSPYLLPLLDAGSVDGQLFFTTPLVTENVELAHLRHTTADITSWIVDAARGAHALHELGVAHRDIRPQTVLISQGHGMLGDLDLAQLLGGGSTSIGGPLGALEFTAPEVLLGSEASRRSDIWSLAMTLHRSITGSSAIGELPDTSLIEACRHVIHTRPLLSEAVPAEIRDVLLCALAEEPTQRFSTAAEFAEALSKVTTGELT